MTPALRTLAKAGINPVLHKYKYVERGGTAASSKALGVPEHRIIKTLVFETEKGSPLIVLMHGDCTVSQKAVARQISVRSVKPCKPTTAQKHSGYRVGGTSPFGTNKNMPVYAEASIFQLETIFINAGRRGLLMEIPSSLLSTLLLAEPIQAAIRKS